MQFVMVLFEYFGYLQTIKMQILNRRFYHGILPNWMHQVHKKIQFRVAPNINSWMSQERIKYLEELQIDQLKLHMIDNIIYKNGKWKIYSCYRLKDKTNQDV